MAEGVAYEDVQNHTGKWANLRHWVVRHTLEAYYSKVITRSEGFGGTKQALLKKATSPFGILNCLTRTHPQSIQRKLGEVRCSIARQRRYRSISMMFF